VGFLVQSVPAEEPPAAPDDHPTRQVPHRRNFAGVPGRDRPTAQTASFCTSHVTSRRKAAAGGRHGRALDGGWYCMEQAKQPLLSW
jgi:hypothetical protein